MGSILAAFIRGFLNSLPYTSLTVSHGVQEQEKNVTIKSVELFFVALL